MTKELQDHVWSILPKEFKLEVKKEYRKGYVCETLTMLITLFGRHNLTSDAEGEEMLTVSRNNVMAYYRDAQEDEEEFHPAVENACNIMYQRAVGRRQMLKRLFGSKCLPDNVDSSEPNVDSLPQNPTENCDNKSHISADCNKPAEPKFKVGDIAVVRGFNHPLLKQDGAIVTILSYHDKGDFYSCAIAPNVGIDVDAKYLEPYTEPVNEADKYFDNILKDSFRNHNRLHIATQITASIYSNDKAASQFNSIEALVRKALDIADTLIAEVEKGAER